MAASSTPGTHRPGGRTARNREAVMQATLEALGELGYADTTVNEIANRAGVACSTIYRRWGDRDGVIRDLAGTLANSTLAVVPDTGDLEADLRILGQAMVDILRNPLKGGVITSSLVSAAVHSPEARTALADMIGSRVEDTKVIAERAVARGEIPPGTDVRQVISTLASPIYHRRFVTAEPLEPEDVARFARIAAHAARHGLLV